MSDFKLIKRSDLRFLRVCVSEELTQLAGGKTTSSSGRKDVFNISREGILARHKISDYSELYSMHKSSKTEFQGKIPRKPL